MKKITQETFKEEIKEWGKGDYEVIGEYETSGKGVEIRHLTCGRTYRPSRDNFKKGKRCYHCYGKPEIDTKTFKEKVRALTGDEYTVIGDYSTAHEKVLLRHNVCGSEYPASPNKFINYNRRCPTCGGTKKKTHEQFVEEVRKYQGEAFEVLGRYTGANTRVLVRHNKCGKEYKVYPSTLRVVAGCADCSFKSRGEESIKSILDSLEVSYESQVTYEGCINIHKLPFDFRLYVAGKAVLIEYDGIQHFKPIDYFGGEEGFKDQKKRDKIKDDFTKQAGIMLIRIPYTEYEVLEEKLKSIIRG